MKPKVHAPPGFVILEVRRQDPQDPEGHLRSYWQAYRASEPTQQSGQYSRRTNAVAWCWKQLGREAVQQH